MYNFHVMQKDTLSQRIISQFQFSDRRDYRLSLRTAFIQLQERELTIQRYPVHWRLKDFSIMPNFSDSKFMARFKYETDRIEARFERYVCT